MEVSPAPWTSGYVSAGPVAATAAGRKVQTDCWVLSQVPSEI
jgi:hypothetical protein